MGWRNDLPELTTRELADLKIKQLRIWSQQAHIDVCGECGRRTIVTRMQVVNDSGLTTGLVCADCDDAQYTPPVAEVGRD